MVRKRAAKKNGPKPRRGQRGRPPGVPLERLRDVEKHLLSTVPQPVYEALLAEKYGVDVSTIRNYARRVRAEWAEGGRAELDEKRATRRNQLEQLYQKCLAATDFRAAVVVLHRLCQLDGLYAPTRVSVDATVGTGAALSVADPERVRERMRALLVADPEMADRVRAALPRRRTPAALDS